MKGCGCGCDVQTMIDDAICAAKREQLVALSSECQLSLEELDGAVQPIIDSCTKEAISVCTCLHLFSCKHCHGPLPVSGVMLSSFSDRRNFAAMWSRKMSEIFKTVQCKLCWMENSKSCTFIICCVCFAVQHGMKYCPSFIYLFIYPPAHLLVCVICADNSCIETW